MEDEKIPNEPTRPLILEIAEAKEEMAKAVKAIIIKHRLPAFFMENIIADIYRQIAASAQQELAQLKADEINQKSK